MTRREDIEARARAIELAARTERKPFSRGVWTAALLVSVACVLGLAIGWWQDHDTVATKPLQHPAVIASNGLWIGLLVGLGVGIALGSLFAVRKNR